MMQNERSLQQNSLTADASQSIVGSGNRGRPGKHGKNEGRQEREIYLSRSAVMIQEATNCSKHVEDSGGNMLGTAI